MLAAAAEARSVLLSLGAEMLKVPMEKLDVKDGIIFNKENSQQSGVTVN
jgi:hypothetical protein